MTGKAKKKTTRAKQDGHDEDPDAGPVLGEDPFEGFDLAWMNREDGELTIEVLGHDPFEGFDVEWLEGEAHGEEYVLVPSTVQRESQFGVDELAEAQLEPSFNDLQFQASAPPPGSEELVLRPVPSETGPPNDPEPLKPPPFIGSTPLARPAPLVTPREVLPPSEPTPAATFYFPADFKWGVTVAAHQVEGNNSNSDWWAWEQEVGHVKEEHTSGLACNWWENAEPDFDYAARMGLNALRLSLEWSRIEPRQGTFDDAALERYSAILRSLRARSIDPMLTLHHFSNPLWLARLGGWESRETVALFARFVRRTVEVLGQHCDLWCTVNEPNLYSYKGYVEGSFPPGETSLKRMRAVTRNLLAGHAAAYREIHDLQPKARVGLAHNMRILDPVDPQLGRDRRAARAADLAYNQAALTALTKGRWPRPVGFGLAWKLRGTLDWIGLNYCARDLVTSDGRQEDPVFKRRRNEEGAELLDGDRGEFYPRGMFRALQRLARLGLPIYVTQNGIPDDDDDQRPRYMISHLHQVWRAIQLCYPVMGYYHRTLVDDFEWDDGWTLRFGLIQFDPRTRDRAPRRSAGLYSDIIRANAITPKIIDAYAPRLRPQLLPGRVVDR